MFIYNTELLMIGVETWYHLLTTIVTAIAAMMLFAAATQGYFIVKCRWWEILALLLIAFTLFRPAYWMDQIYPPLESRSPSDIYEIAGAMPVDAQIRIRVVGEDMVTERPIDKTVMLPLGAAGSGEDRLFEAGLEIIVVDGKTIVDNVVFGSTAERQKIDFDFEIVSVEVATDRPGKQWFYLPALLVLGLIVMLQRGRREKSRPSPPPSRGSHVQRHPGRRRRQRRDVIEEDRGRGGRVLPHVRRAPAPARRGSRFRYEHRQSILSQRLRPEGGRRRGRHARRVQGRERSRRHRGERHHRQRHRLRRDSGDRQKIDADLIVLGANRPDLKDYLLGPNASRVVRHSARSVLVVRD